MPRTGAMEIIQGYVTAPSTTLTAVTVASGNSLTVRYTPGQPYLLDYWANNQGAGQLVIKSARLHDQVNGINPQVPATETFSLSGVFPQKLVPQDTLTVLLSGTATGAAIEHVCLQVYYDNLPGSNGIFLRKSELFRFGLFEMTSEITITGLTSGEWGTARAINASQDVFKANTYYAIVGILTDTRCAAIRVRSSDFGNLGIGVPGEHLMKEQGRSYFTRLSDNYGLPLIPCFNSANKAGTLVDVAINQAGGSPKVSICCVQLTPDFDPQMLN